jgi:opacity protein-like surface antigen
MKKVFVAVALSAAFVVAPAFAETYVGAGVGIANTDSNNASYKLFAGFQSTQYLGAEIAYNDFGKYRSASGNAWSIAGIGTYPLNKLWNLTAKLGATINHTNLAGASRHSDLLTGVGVGYIVAPNMIVRLEYEDFGSLPKDAIGTSSKANNWGLNARYSF